MCKGGQKCWGRVNQNGDPTDIDKVGSKEKRRGLKKETEQDSECGRGAEWSPKKPAPRRQSLKGVGGKKIKKREKGKPDLRL